MAMDFGKLNFAVSFNRTSAFPLEANGYFESYDAAVAAVAGAAEVGSSDSAYYFGQQIVVVDNDVVTLYVIEKATVDTSVNTRGYQGQLKEVGSKTLGDDASIELSSEGVLSLYGFTDAGNKCVPYKDTATGKLVWGTVESLIPDAVVPVGDNETILVSVDGNDSTKRVVSLLGKEGAADKAVLRKHISDEGVASYTWDVIYDKAEVNALLNDKVDKVEGKGLSTNDYDDAAVAEVAKIKDKAEKSTVEGIDTRVGDLETKIAGVTGAMHFKGVLESLPADLGDYVAGDVVVVDKKEYVCAESGEGGAKEWHELGDEGSHLTKDEAAKTYKTIESYNTEKTVIEGSISAVSEKVTVIENDYLKAADKTALETAIGDKADQSALDEANTAAAVLKGRVDTIEKDYLKGNDKTELQGAIDLKASQEALDTANGKITALETSVGKAAAGEEAATGLYKAIADESAARVTLAGRVSANEGNIGTLQTQVGTSDDTAAADGSLYARIKKLSDDLAEAGKIDGITINGEAVTIENKIAKIELPAAFISSLAEGEDNLAVENGKLSLAKVSTDKLVNGEKTLVLNGGTAND